MLANLIEDIKRSGAKKIKSYGKREFSIDRTFENHYGADVVISIERALTGYDIEAEKD
jgi:hypothetical protein